MIFSLHSFFCPLCTSSSCRYVLFCPDSPTLSSLFLLKLLNPLPKSIPAPYFYLDQIFLNCMFLKTHTFVLRLKVWKWIVPFRWRCRLEMFISICIVLVSLCFPHLIPLTIEGVSAYKNVSRQDALFNTVPSVLKIARWQIVIGQFIPAGNRAR